MGGFKPNTKTWKHFTIYVNCYDECFDSPFYSCILVNILYYKKLIEFGRNKHRKKLLQSRTLFFSKTRSLFNTRNECKNDFPMYA